MNDEIRRDPHHDPTTPRRRRRKTNGRSTGSSFEVYRDTAKDPRKETGAASDKIAAGLAAGTFAGYDPEAFYLRTSDAKGHVKNIQINLPQSYGAPIMRVVESPIFPYRTIADAARNWIIHGMARDIAKIEGGEPGDYENQAWWALEQVEHQTKVIADQTEYLNAVEVGLTALMQVRDWEPAIRTLANLRRIDLATGLDRRRLEIIHKYSRELPDARRRSFELSATEEDDTRDHTGDHRPTETPVDRSERIAAARARSAARRR